MALIFGREKELEIFNQLLQSDEAQFLSVYGRRRIGKTFLIHNYFSSKSCYFEMTGLKDAKIAVQLHNFYSAFCSSFPHLSTATTLPKNWYEAFDLLKQAINQQNNTSKMVVFYYGITYFWRQP